MDSERDSDVSRQAPDEPSLKTNDHEGAVTQATDADYKAALDRAAHEARSGNGTGGGGETGEGKRSALVEKVSEYVPPTVGKMLGITKHASEEASTGSSAPPPTVPPQRPHHDAQIEEFVRDQHRSKSIADQMESSAVG